MAAVAAGASALGFIFYPKSPRYVTPSEAAVLGEGLGAWKVGVFVDESPAAIEAVVRAARLDVAQVYGGAGPASARIWRAFRPTQSICVEGAEAILLDGPATGISFDWEVARDPTHKVIVAGGLDASNVADAIRIANPWGVDASSKLETAPGIKDHEKVRAFVRAARAESLRNAI